MEFRLDRDDLGHLACTLADDQSRTTVTAAGLPEAAAYMTEALDALEKEGYGECYWDVTTGQYWWVLKKKGELVDVAVMWMASIITGWQHVFRSETPCAGFLDQARAELAKF